MKALFSTKEVAQYLGVNEKMVYTLVAEKGLPASKVTGKWIFPQHLVEQWVVTHTQNLPSVMAGDAIPEGLLVMAGSNDPLLDQAISLHNSRSTQRLAVFGNMGSMGGIRALKQRLCQVATSHLLQEDGDEYNFDFISKEVLPTPVVVNFCRRRQGLVVARENPKEILSTADLGRPGLRVVNRKLGTGTRLLFDQELKAAGIQSQKLSGYNRDVARHMDVGLAILAGRADAGPCIQPVAEQLGLHFIPWRWERYDLLILKERFFDPAVQGFLGLLHEKDFRNLTKGLDGYDLSIAGQMIFPTKIEN
ncbi:MAG: helix-turn-helix transcriptional regulator [Desulfobacteraceae bacterium]|jgi:putative molybdopterin biosynthesis protein